MKVILQYDLEGNLLEEHDLTKTEIANMFGVTHVAIGQAVTGQVLSVAGFQWREVTKSSRKCARVGPVYDLIGADATLKIAKYYKGRLISVYDGLDDAAYKNRIDRQVIYRMTISTMEVEPINGFIFKKIE